MKTKLLIVFCLTCGIIKAQQAPIQYFRANDKSGLNVFETTKEDTTSFKDFKLRIGANFAIAYQSLGHQNNATAVLDTAGVNLNELKKLTNGVNFPMANLNLDAQLGDGIRLNVTVYLSTQRHRAVWVKGGYIQFDKLAFLKSNLIDNIMKSVTIKAGMFEVDYGDQHFRRSDGGNTIYNPFVENYIMDQFTTEAGVEIYYHSKSGFLAMGGITNGQLDATVTGSTDLDAATGKLNRYLPALLAKLGYDKKLNGDLRIRITGSVYTIKSTEESTLFFGDRAGSHYYQLMENTTGVFDEDEEFARKAWSGRYNPEFSQQVTTFMLNPFVKYKGLELFGTYEVAKGRTITEVDMRKATQYAVDLIYRFPQDKENFWIGVRYNSVTAAPSLNTNDIIINRAVGSAGWFLTKNIMMKAEYVSQQYKRFEPTDIRSGGKFSGFVVEASIGF